MLSYVIFVSQKYIPLSYKRLYNYKNELHYSRINAERGIKSQK